MMLLGCWVAGLLSVRAEFPVPGSRFALVSETGNRQLATGDQTEQPSNQATKQL